MDVDKYKEAIRAWLDGAQLVYLYQDGNRLEALPVEDCAATFDAAQITQKPTAHVHAAAITEWIKNPADWTVRFKHHTDAEWSKAIADPSWVPYNSYKMTSKSTGKEIISHGQC